MPELDYTNLEEAWDSHPASKEDGPDRIYELTFYSGATAAIRLLLEGRSLRTLDMEVGDWIACHRERMNAKR